MNCKENISQVLDDYKLNLSFYFSEAIAMPLAKPYWIYISPSFDCNFNCQMCGVKKILRGQELTLSTLQNVLGEIAKWKSPHVITLTGGEPFLRQDIFEIIGSAVKLGLTIEAVSNGSQINSAFIAERIIKSGLRNIAISLDGASAQTHDFIRQTPGAYQGVLTALDYLSKAKKKLAAKWPQISVWTTVMKENVDELADIIPIVKQRGAECLVYHPVVIMQVDMQNTVKSGSFWLEKDDIRRLKEQIDAIVAYKEKNGLVAFQYDPYLWLKYFDRKLTKREWKCNPFVFIGIGPDCLVSSCGRAFGNLREISLTECLTTPEAHRARETMRRCAKPCLQTCWARPEAESLKNIVQNFVLGVTGADAHDSAKKAALESGFAILEEHETLIMRHANHKTKT